MGILFTVLGVAAILLLLFIVVWTVAEAKRFEREGETQQRRREARAEQLREKFALKQDQKQNGE